MAIKFYNVKKRKKVQINESDVEKQEFVRELPNGKRQVRYAFRAKDDDGTSLTKFCSKDDYDRVNVPVRS